MDEPGVNPQGRRVNCPCCGRGIIVRAEQVWPHTHYDASLIIISPERHGAVVVQVGREDERYGISYRSLLRDYVPPVSSRERARER